VPRSGGQNSMTCLIVHATRHVTACRKQLSGYYRAIRDRSDIGNMGRRLYPSNLSQGRHLDCGQFFAGDRSVDRPFQAQSRITPVLLPSPNMGDRQPLHERCKFAITLRPQQQVPVILHHYICAYPIHQEFRARPARTLDSPRASRTIAFARSHDSRRERLAHHERPALFVASQGWTLKLPTLPISDLSRFPLSCPTT
jgi:hypothetical protein